jgi:long-chain acyl-CoA synthetase
MPVNLYDLFAATARRQPDRPAVLGPGPDDLLTYRALDEAVVEAAARLRGAGVRPGDCVGLHCPSGAAYIAYTYAVWRVGGCVVPVPVELAAPEKCDVLRTISVAFLISPPQAAAFAAPFAAGDAAGLPLVAAVAPGARPPRRL